MINFKDETLIQLIKTEIKRAIIKQMDFVDTHKIKIDQLNIEVDRTRNPKFGDYSSNVAMSLNLNSEETMEIANLIAASLPTNLFKAVAIVKPGFINITMNHDFNSQVIKDICSEKDEYGKFKSKKVFYNIEFVSANPTGLLHIGHARNAAIGDSLVRVWEQYGIKVNREYYINDAGNQIEKLGLSVLIRYLELFDKKISLPEDSYHGTEIIDIAVKLKEQYKDRFLNLAYDEQKMTGDKEETKIIKDFAKSYLLNIIKNTLLSFGVKMDIWFSESTLYENNIIPNTLKMIENNTYSKDSALWLSTTKYGDDKDRVLIKSDGSYTYFTPDIAYHNIKLSRGYDRIFNIWGSDHMSYVDRMKIAVEMLGYKREQLHVLIMQMVRLIKGGQEFKMSKRSGNSLTLQDLLDTIGKDAARWFLVAQSLSTHLEIDVDKAVCKNNDNPLYYVQYAHARINQILAKANYEMPDNFDLLVNPSEVELINLLHYFKHTIEVVSDIYEVNKLTLYLTNLARAFHSYYANTKIVDDNNLPLSAQRYYLALAIKQVIKNGLGLLNIVALDKM